MEDAEEVFEDALEDVDGEVTTTPLNINNNHLHNKSAAKSSLRTFRLGRVKKQEKHVTKDKQASPTDLEEGPIPLALGLEEASLAIDLFFNNQFEKAKEISRKYCDRSIYHALGYGTFHYLKAVMTFDQEYVELASSVLSQSVSTIDRFRRKSSGITDSIGKIVRKQDYDSYTELEIHAELVYAECLLLKAMLTVCEDETLVSFVKAGLKVRQCYVSFRECWTILQTRDWSGDQHKSHFEGGVRLGVGTFNLLMSLLPPRITKLLEFVGFTGSRDVGMKELLTCYRDQSCLRQFLASIILLGYHLFLCNHMGQVSNSDYTLVDEILTSKLSKYPNGAFFLFFKGRYELVQGQCNSALDWYRRANKVQSEWPQFHHVACWEMIWASSYQCQWREAVRQAGRLLEESRWSPCIYSYLKAAFYCMFQDELTSEERTEQRDLMTAVPNLRQKIAGKSLPMEKFAARKADRFTKQGGRLVLPGLELVYLWNGFTILGDHYDLVERFYVLVQGEQAKLMPGDFRCEDECLLLLLKGMCLKHMSAPLAAEECFREVVERGPKMSVDKYLVPYTMVELALLLMDQGEDGHAQVLLEKAKTMFKDYSLQSRLHFRIHAAQNKMKEPRDATETVAQQRGAKGIGEEVLPHLTNYEEPASTI